jgi:chemotaxis protein methyltransferase CheR
MTAELPDSMRLRLSEFVADRLGLHFPQKRWGDLERGVGAAAQECGSRDVAMYVQRLLSPTSTSSEIDKLAKHLTVGETYFFREKHSLEILEEEILRALILTPCTTRRQLRVWSAGCATGEEPYSVAMLISRLMPDTKAWTISILATDLNPCSLDRAVEGVYGEWSFRTTPSWVRSTYFKVTGDGRWAIIPAVKESVTFARLNLVADHYPSPYNSNDVFDVILCRNVLMYFTPGAAEKIVSRLYRALAPGGWLIVGTAEASHGLFSEFAAAGSRDGPIYKKAARWPNMAATTDPERPSMTAGPTRVRFPILEHREPPTIDSQTPRAEPATASGVDGDPLQRARLLANQRRFPEALGHSDNAIRLDKMNSRAHYLRGMILQEQGRLDEAVRSMRRAIYANPEFVLAHFALGNLAMRQQKPQESRKCFDNALELLAEYGQGDLLPDSDGLTAGRLREWVGLELDQAIAMEAGDREPGSIRRQLQSSKGSS